MASYKQVKDIKEQETTTIFQALAIVNSRSLHPHSRLVVYYTFVISNYIFLMINFKFHPVCYVMSRFSDHLSFNFTRFSVLPQSQ